MRAYLRGARDYNDALDGDRLTAPAAADVIPILTEYSFIKNPDVYKAMRSHYVDPNGTLNVASLKDVWQFFREAKQIDGSVTVDDVVDPSFAPMGRRAARALQEEDGREVAFGVIARRSKADEAISATRSCASEVRLLRGVYPRARRRRDRGLAMTRGNYSNTKREITARRWRAVRRRRPQARSGRPESGS